MPNSGTSSKTDTQLAPSDLKTLNSITEIPIMNHSAPTRRDLLRELSCGFGYAALAGLTSEAAAADSGRQDALAPVKPHFTPRARATSITIKKEIMITDK